MKEQAMFWFLVGVIVILVGCQAPATAVALPPTFTAVPGDPLTPSPPALLTPAAAPTWPILPSPAPPTAVPTPTQTPPPTQTAPPPATFTATPVGPCVNRLVAEDDLWAIITQSHGLSRDYTPPNLVSLNDFLGNDVTLGYPIEVRQVMVTPLVDMIADMQAEGLQPQVLSGYRSYSAQAIAYDKWAREFPGHVNIISAPPGHSEHQLGTTIDFGSPELPLYTGDPNLQFHTYFYKTSEGIWLLTNAHRYGFTLSWPLETFELTGFYYEPWHYRYVGVEMATSLHAQGVSLTEYQLANQPEPCIPNQ